MATRNWVAPGNSPVEFLALGDSRGGHGGDVALLMRWVLEDAIDIYHFHPEFMVNSGDLVYNGGNRWSNWYWDFTDRWAEFLGYEPWQWLLARYPLMAALGNHDFDVDSHAGQDKDHADISNWYTYLPYPHAPAGVVGDSYTYNVNGQVWFFTLDTFPMWGCYCCGCDNLKSFSAQYQWLDSTLTDIENSARQWKIVLMHAPLYSPGDCNLYKTNFDLETLLEKHGVDLVIAGHEHYYSRKTVLTTAAGSPNSDIVHLVMGGAGASLSDFGDTTGYDCALKMYHFADIRIDGDVLVGKVVYAGPESDAHNRGDIVDTFTIDRTPKAHFGYQSLAGGRVLSEASDPVEQAPPPGSIRVLFQDQSKGHRYLYLWDFGDGTATSTERNPTHYYAKPGIYKVTLTIKSMWNQSSLTRQVAAAPPLPPHVLQLLILD